MNWRNSGGPKFYAFRVEKADGQELYVCKVKGIRINYKTASLVNFNSIRNLVCNESDNIVISPENIRRTAYHEVVTVKENKICRPVYTKRRFVSLEKSFPFGYKS